MVNWTERDQGVCPDDSGTQGPQPSGAGWNRPWPPGAHIGCAARSSQPCWWARRGGLAVFLLVLLLSQQTDMASSVEMMFFIFALWGEKVTPRLEFCHYGPQMELTGGA